MILEILNSSSCKEEVMNTRGIEVVISLLPTRIDE